MDKIQILQEIFNTCIIPLLGVLCAYIISFLKKKKDEIENHNEEQKYQRYLTMLIDTTIKCIKATNQEYVNALKDKNAFTKEAQAEAFKKSFQAIIGILNEDQRAYFSTLYGDFDLYLQKLIESLIEDCKK